MNRIIILVDILLILLTISISIYLIYNYSFLGIAQTDGYSFWTYFETKNIRESKILIYIDIYIILSTIYTSLSYLVIKGRLRQNLIHLHYYKKINYISLLLCIAIIMLIATVLYVNHIQNIVMTFK